MAQGGNCMQLQRQAGEPLIDFIVDQSLGDMKKISEALNKPGMVVTFVSHEGMQKYLNAKEEYKSRVPNPRYKLIQALITDQQSKLLPTFTMDEVFNNFDKIQRFSNFFLKIN